MEMYDHKLIEKKWQEYWTDNKLFETSDSEAGKENLYSLVEFPYPSGNLHIGHWYAFAIPDIYARVKKMQGHNVLFPIGFDAFGLPAENAAIKNKVNPQEWTYQNIEKMHQQLGSMGASFDWSREVVTCDPEYYKWTQWMFLQFFQNNLAYQSLTRVNWCPSCKTVLANEQVVAGACERCESEVEQKEMKQWQLKITDYAEKLLSGLDELDWPEEIKDSQRNWIGKSEGAKVKFQISNSKFQIEVFTTRPDTLFGATYIVLAPEHELISDLKSQISNWPEVEKYIKQSQKKTELERLEEAKDKTGVELQGVKAINPVNNEEIPIFIADYVLMGYGTGAIMAVPAHDDRDFEFAKKFNLPIRQVVAPHFVSEDTPPKKGLEFVPRDALVCIVKNPKTNRYLCLQWKASEDWKTFLTGGADEGEDIIDAAKREIMEETGYNNLNLIRQLQFEGHDKFYHLVKKVNRYAKFTCLAFELVNEDQLEVSQEEKDLHDVIWIKESEVRNFVKAGIFRHFWDEFNSGDRAYSGEGVVMNSDEFDGLSTEEFKEKIIKWLEKKKLGQGAINYRMRDWLVSRQRYWGCPIPIIHCNDCGATAVPEKDLPVELPNLDDYAPRDDGKSPLAKHEQWLKVKCPKCGQSAERESDTLDTFVDSSWYFLRYADPQNSNEFAEKQKMKQWLPVDYYSGGAEHTTMHLLYSRFWIKAMHDLKLLDFDEPYVVRKNRGLIMGPDGQKMSKSKGNVVDPDEYVDKLGADTVRMYLAFIGPYNEAGAYPWDLQGIMGVRKFLDRIWRLREKVGTEAKEDSSVLKLLHQTIKKVTEDIDKLKFNTAVSQLMILVNLLDKQPQISQPTFESLTLLLSGFVPHLAEELWQQQGHKDSILLAGWPGYDSALARVEEIELVVQINGKVRDKVKATADISQPEAEKLVLELDKIKAQLQGQQPIKIIFVPGRLINIVV